MRPSWPLESPVGASAEPRLATRCAWCREPFGPEAELLAGRRRCPDCGVATTDPWPTPDELARAYDAWYRPAAGRFSGIGDALLKRARASLAGRLDRLAPPGRVLDVGAGDGVLLDALRSHGREAVGIEPHSDRRDVLDAALSELEGEFAAIVLWHSLEHLPDPSETLDQAARLLRHRGLLVVAIPNAASLQAQALGDRWFALDLPRHLTHIPAPALIERIRATGLQVERVSHVRGGQIVFGWLHGLVGGLPGRPDLYDAIRRPEARRRSLSATRRLAVLIAGVILLPAALLLAAAEVMARRGGTVEVEARHG